MFRTLILMKPTPWTQKTLLFLVPFLCGMTAFPAFYRCNSTMMSTPPTLTKAVLSASLLYLAIVSLPPCKAICYYPDGVHVAPQDVPCNGGSSNSVCCGPGYACLSNQICMRTNQTLDNHSSQTFVRGSCTDRKWLSAACPSFCTSNQDGGEGMKKCEGSEEDSYCCLQGALCTDKCDKGPVIIRFQGEPSVVTTVGVTATDSRVLRTDESSTRTQSASQIATESRATPSSAVRETGPHSSTDLKVGVGVGVPLGVIALIFATYVIWKKTRKSEPTRLLPDSGDTYRDKSRDEGQHKENSPAYRMEPLIRHELEWDNNARELSVEADTRLEAGH